MKIYFSLILSVFFLVNCNTHKSTNNYMMEGKVTKESLKKEFPTWYNDFYTNYELDTATLNEISSSFNNSNNKIELFMGTWCGDSHRDTPRFVKIMEYLNFTNYTIIALDRDKNSKEGFEKGKNIVRIPTIIIYGNKNEELNRIIESPVNSLEKDLINITSKNNYKPNYYE